FVSGSKEFNLNKFDRPNYYCSQLVAAAYASAGIALYSNTIDLTPGELAAVPGRHQWQTVGALFDLDYHHAVRDNRDFFASDRQTLLENDKNMVRTEAER